MKISPLIPAHCLTDEENAQRCCYIIITCVKYVALSLLIRLGTNIRYGELVNVIHNQVALQKK